MLYKNIITLSAFFLCLFAFTVMTATPVLASDFGKRLTKCNNKKGKGTIKETNNKKEAKIECYQNLVSDIINELKKECDNQYKNLTTKLKGHKRATFSEAQDYCLAGKKINCFKELAKKANKQFDYYEETGYCK